MFIPIKKTNSRGLTLIEILLVVMLIAGIVVTAADRFAGVGNNNIKSTMRKIAGTTRQAHSFAKLENLNYRLAIELGEKDPKVDAQAFWLEKTNRKVYLDEDLDKSKKKEKDKEAKNNGGFVLDTRLIRKPQQMPPDIYFESVEMGSREDPITRGRAYVNFLSEGLADEAVIHIKHKTNDKFEYSLAVHPLTGKIDIIPRRVTLKELRE